MYGYNQSGYGSYPSSYSNAAAASVYGGLGQAVTPTQSAAGLYGSSTSNPYANYGNSAAVAAAYGAQSNNSAQAAAYAQATQVAQQLSQATRINDAYAAAALSSQFGAFSNAAYGSTAPAPPSTTFKPSTPKGPGGLPPANISKPTNSQAPFKTSQFKGTSSSSSNSNVFSNYDAAVFAAASSYLQSKAAGTTNMWMSKKPNQAQKAGGQYSQKRFSNNAGVQKESQQFYCEVCKISCAGQLTYKEHLEGQRHKKKEALAKGENAQSLPKNKVSFRCDLCNVTCTGQDTYNAHVRGSKHQKTLALCKKLGKPIPSTEPTIIPPSEMGGTVPAPAATGAPIPTVGNTGNVKRVVGIQKVSFVGGTKLSSTGQLAMSSDTTTKPIGPTAPGTKAPVVDATAKAVKSQSEELQALIAAEQNVQPVGEEYIEAQKDSTGKLLQYLCKLCDCKFSDPNAKEIHLKGRRHRLQYKMKVDPNLVVEMKQPTRSRNPREARRGLPGAVTPTGSPMGFGAPFRGPPMWFASARGYEGRRFETTDDRHVHAKHIEICPTEEELTKTESLVSGVETALKKVSDFFHERDHPKKEEKATEAATGGEDADRLLKGVMRVGKLAKNLMLKGDVQTDLVVLCSVVPTQSLLKEIVRLLPEYYQKGDYQLTITEDVPNAAMALHRTDCDVVCRVKFTSRVFREEATAEGATATPIPADSLPKNACLEALAQLRRSKWFQARCVFLQSCQITLRILRDLRKRLDGWLYLNDWTCELLVEKALASSPTPLSIGEALRRVFEAVASGVLLHSGPGLQDPCEKERTDVLSELTALQREAITTAAQNALRLMAFQQLYKVLDMERLPDVRPSLIDRKRPIEKSNDDGTDEKKVKKDEAEGEEVKMEA